MIRVLILILVVMSSVAFAQIQEKPKAIKFAEFGTATNSFVKEKMDEFLMFISIYPKAQFIAINYGTERQIILRESQLQKVINWRCDYNCPRFTIIRGGKIKSAKLETELWIVPPEANNPEIESDKVRQTEQKQSSSFAPFRLEKFGEVSDNFFNEIFNEFFEIVKQKQTSNGYIVLNGTKNEIEVFEDRIKKLEFFDFYKSDRIIFLRKIESPKQATISLWIVPQNDKFSAQLEKNERIRNK